MLRVNPDGVADALAAIERIQQDQQTSLLQIATGRRVNKPSDDPAAAAAVVQNHDRSQQADQFLHSISGIKAQLQSADATINSVVGGVFIALTVAYLLHPDSVTAIGVGAAAAILFASTFLRHQWTTWMHVGKAIPMDG